MSHVTRIIDLDSDDPAAPQPLSTWRQSTTTLLDRDIRTWSMEEKAQYRGKAFQVDAVINASVNPLDSLGENSKQGHILQLFLSDGVTCSQAALLDQVSGISSRPEHSGTKIIVNSFSYASRDTLPLLYANDLLVLGGNVDRLKTNSERAIQRQAQQHSLSLFERYESMRILRS